MEINQHDDPVCLTTQNSLKSENLVIDEGSQQLPKPVAATEYVVTAKKNDEGVVYQMLYPAPDNQSSLTPVQICQQQRHQLITHDQNGFAKIPVKCGNIVGKMHLEMFLCPGIHQPCIEINGEFLSPKQFTVLGDKEKQKDWKASIRIGKSTLRTHMESSTIEFFDHPNQCSGKCQSRNYVNTPTMREEVMMIRRQQRNVDRNYLKREIGTSAENSNVPTKENEEVVRKRKETETQNPLGERRGRGRPRGSGNKRMKQDIAPEYFYGAHPNSQMNAQHVEENQKEADCSSHVEILRCLQLEPQHFWSQMQSAGVIAHFCDDIIVNAINIKHSVLAPEPISERVATMLSKAVFALNIQKTIVNRVQVIEKCFSDDKKRAQSLNDGRVEGAAAGDNEGQVTLDDVINRKDDFPTNRGCGDSMPSTSAGHEIRELSNNNNAETIDDKVPVGISLDLVPKIDEFEPNTAIGTL